MSERYATYKEYEDYLTEVYPRLYLDSNEVVQPSWFEKDVDIAEAYASTYVECRYDVTDLTENARLFVFQICRAKLLSIAYNREDFAQMPDNIEDGLKRAMAQLLDIRDGEFCDTWTITPPVDDDFVFPYTAGCAPVWGCPENGESL